jgi:hypothetical protein
LIARVKFDKHVHVQPYIVRLALFSWVKLLCSFSIFYIQLPAQLERIPSLVAQKMLHNDIFHRSLPAMAYHFVYTQAVPNPAVANMAVLYIKKSSKIPFILYYVEQV